MREVSEGPGGMTVLVYGAGDLDRLSARVDTSTVLLRRTDGRIETATRSEILLGPPMANGPVTMHSGVGQYSRWSRIYGIDYVINVPFTYDPDTYTTAIVYTAMSN